MQNYLFFLYPPSFWGFILEIYGIFPIFANMKHLLIIILASFFTLSGYSQTNKSHFFNTLGRSKKNTTIKTIKNEPDAEIKDDTLTAKVDTDTAKSSSPKLSTPSFDSEFNKTREQIIEEIERYLEQKGRYTVNRQGKTVKVWRLYDKRGSLPFSLDNLISVMKEEGIKEPLVVLAQALLETGYFTSNVFKKYNNLFGLYDSTNKDYYHFQRWEDSVTGYIKFIQYRYKGGNYLNWLRKIGYAEDYGYISKLRKIMKSINKI